MKVLLGRAGDADHTRDDGVTLELGDGTRVEGDLLVVGIGLGQPNDALAAAAAPRHRQRRAPIPAGAPTAAIFAAGDVANALPTARRAPSSRGETPSARAAPSRRRPPIDLPDPNHAGPPWFWSDQYDDNLQVPGTTRPCG